MSKFLLVHGSMHGSWCWDRLASELFKRGHEVYMLDLPGHGNDTTPRRTITRQTYIEAVRNYLTANNLFGVTLVGHSLAGTILPEIWETSRERLDNLVFLAALVLRAGEAVIDLVPENRRSTYFEMSSRSFDNSFLIDAAKARVLFFSDLSNEEASIFYEKLTPQPFGVYLDRNKKSPSLPKERVRYIVCTADQVLPPELWQRFAAELGIPAEEINAGHDAMLSHPSELAEILLKDQNTEKSKIKATN